MAYLVVPHEVSASTATIWVGVIDEPFNPDQVRLASHLGEHPLPPDWEHWVSRDATHRLDYQRLTITGLQPRASLRVQLLVNGQPQADARLTTLPSELPTLAEKPFTVLLGSCFCKREDAEGALGRTYAQLPSGARPEVKILCGDQVYLDNPWRETTLKWYRANQKPGLFRAMLFDKYVANWTQISGDPLFRAV